MGNDPKAPITGVYGYYLDTHARTCVINGNESIEILIEYNAYIDEKPTHELTEMAIRMVPLFGVSKQYPFWG